MRYIWILALISLIGCGGHPAVERPRVVKIAIMPEYSLNKMTERYHLLVSYLEKALGPKYRVEWVSCPSHDGFVGAVEGAKPDISIQDLYFSAILSKLQGAFPILQTIAPDGSTTTEGLIVVPEGKGIKDIEELRGKKISIYSRRSLLGFIAQADMLKREGIDPFRDVKLIKMRWQDKLVESLEKGDVDAGFIRKEALRPGLRAIARTRSFPTDYVLAFPHTPPELIGKIRDALIGLNPTNPSHAEILGAMEIRGFKAVDRSERESLLSILKEFYIPY